MRPRSMPNSLATAEDIADVIAGVRLLREIAATAPALERHRIGDAARHRRSNRMRELLQDFGSAQGRYSTR